jgi:NAD(P)-dependent dehydrogenase (short-subunit alcohol dehydrogenase family)
MWQLYDAVALGVRVHSVLMQALKGKVAVVTGAGSGLGREYALALARNGASVVVNDLGVSVTGTASSGDTASAVTAEIVALGGRAVANRDSVSDWHGAERIVESALREFGRLDIVINNAGNNRPTSLVGLSETDIDVQLGTHLKGTLAVSHFAAQYWADAGPVVGRAIINTTSAVGLHPAPGGGIYGAAKAGVIALTVSHAQELAKYGVRVNAIAPCARTRMVEASPNVLALMPTTDGFDRHAAVHVTPLVLYLASSQCRFTGRVFAIEGPDVAMYQPHGVEKQWSTEGQWTPEMLAEVFESHPERCEVNAFFPGGVVPYAEPSGRTLRDLEKVARSEGLEPPTL